MGGKRLPLKRNGKRLRVSSEKRSANAFPGPMTHWMKQKPIYSRTGFGARTDWHFPAGQNSYGCHQLSRRLGVDHSDYVPTRLQIGVDEYTTNGSSIKGPAWWLIRDATITHSLNLPQLLPRPRTLDGFGLSLREGHVTQTVSLRQLRKDR